MHDLDEKVRGALREVASSYRTITIEPRARFDKRYHRRRMAVTAAFAVILLTVGSAVFLGTKIVSRNTGRAADSRPARQVVPWKDTKPAATYADGYIPAADANDPACSASQLRGRLAGSNAASGRVGILVTLSNTGKSVCALEGTPSVDLVLSDGKTLVAEPGGPTYFPATGPTRVRVEPGVTVAGNEAKPGEAIFTFEWIDCSAKPVVGANVKLPRGGIVNVAFPDGPPDRSGIAGCGDGKPPSGSMISVGRVAGVARESERDDFGALAVSVSAPVKVARGERLRFEVTLTNTGKDRVAFGSCPNYFENLAGDGIKVVGRYRLNCDAAPAIDPGLSVTFEMFLEIPASSRYGAAALSWGFEPTIATPTQKPAYVTIT